MKEPRRHVPDFNGKFWDFFNANQHQRFIVNVGGAGSAKSYSTAQWFVHMMYTLRDTRFLIARKNMPSLRITAMQLILDLLKAYNLPYDLHDTAPVILSTGNGNRTLFRGLDDPEKIKSFEPHKIWWEEASDFKNRDFVQMNLRMRGMLGARKQLFLSLNPIDKLNSWIYKQFWERERKNAAILQSTWRDNRRHLDQEYIDELESLELEDKTTYDIYNLGEWGVLANTIYTNWVMVDDFPTSVGDRFYGLDFGWNHPTALDEVRVIDDIIYEKELLYKTHLTNNDLINELKIAIPVALRNEPIYADSAEPARIEEIRRAGFNIFPAQKDVIMGIDFVKRFHTNLVLPSVNLKKEKEAYKYKEDKDGNILEEPVKFHDDLMDAERYAIFTHLWRRMRRKVGRKPKTRDELGLQ